MKVIERTEATTGGPKRTPREEIVPLITVARGSEPEGYWDMSQSTGWEVAPPEGSQPSRYTVMKGAIQGFIIPFEQLDTEAAKEQAEGDDDKGGVYFYPFNHQFLPIGEGDDDGDLNSANFAEKMGAFERNYFVNGLPQGGTKIMEAIRAGDQHFFGTKREPGEFFDKPRAERPIRLRTVWTDGELKDHDAFAKYMEGSKVDENNIGVRADWDEVWAVAVFGYGQDHDAVLRQYQDLAKKHANIHVYSFDQVRNPDEVAEDMAIAALPQAEAA
jgi:hypothetical protein